MLDLARELGMSIRQVEQLDSREVAEWMAYFRVEGEEATKEAIAGGAVAQMNKAKQGLKRS